MDKEYIIVLITTPSKELGEEIAHTLLEKKTGCLCQYYGADFLVVHLGGGDQPR